MLEGQGDTETDEACPLGELSSPAGEVGRGLIWKYWSREARCTLSLTRAMHPFSTPTHIHAGPELPGHVLSCERRGNRGHVFLCGDKDCVCESERCSVVSDYLRPLGPRSPWNSPGQNTGVSSHSLLQGIFPTQGWNPGLPHCRRTLHQLSHIASSVPCSPVSSAWTILSCPSSHPHFPPYPGD